MSVSPMLRSMRSVYFDMAPVLRASPPPKERNLLAMNLSIVQGLSFDRFIMPQPQLMFKICGLEKSGDGAIIQAKIFMEGFL